MDGYSFSLAGVGLMALPSGALWWPEAGLLTVSDLHFGKSERLARRGGSLLPPYETQATLTKLDGDLEATGAGQVICLGDSFDDLASEGAMEESCRLWLLRLMAGRVWTWVEGNHDPGPLALPGAHRGEVALGPLVFRHICTGAAGEVSGHYHPKARLPGKVAPCFLVDKERVILPAYGTYTGGLWSDAPELQALMAPDALAVLTGTKCLIRPMRG
ncbi:ligase-associated DNA damage response endonuclease PdeM [Stagnihabitans tardus]|uniref:Ligase-associated DNA damage response endonuclease PdeM n=1 Tax=Stagnihabitans tardus TaxID=2699202 RepID=A0AAE4Y7G0_9RHOB|nr:ligase-associated DNA damage response endonuclease PdeM [Stagnihabitans tardus]NBZ87282.1 ligase-associated DNA damage response endonuclease PdeM [Stagnihabitans tardus]